MVHATSKIDHRCYGLRVVNIPNEAELFHKRILSDGISYSYSAIEFGASNETQFKTWSLIRDSSPRSQHSNGGDSGLATPPVTEFSYEDSRFPKFQAVATKKNKNKNSLTEAAPIFIPEKLSPAPYFHPLMFSTTTQPIPAGPPPPPALVYFHFSSSTARLPFISSTTAAPTLKVTGKKAENSFAKNYLRHGRPFQSKQEQVVGVEQINSAVRQIMFSMDNRHEYSVHGSPTSTHKPILPVTRSSGTNLLSPGYSRVVQNAPNSLPVLIFSTNEIDEYRNSNKHKNSSQYRDKKKINLSRIIRTRQRPRHRYSSNYSAVSRNNALRVVESRRLGGMINQTKGKADENVMMVYPINFTMPPPTWTPNEGGSGSGGGITTTESSAETEGMSTTTEHSTITKIPNRDSPDVILNVTAQAPNTLDAKVRARLKAIRKIVRRLPP